MNVKRTDRPRIPQPIGSFYFNVCILQYMGGFFAAKEGAMRILLAEDENDLRNILTKKLTEEGYGVDACGDGITALSYMEATTYDAMILDVMMPGMDGFSVLKQARAQGIGIPALFLTARDALADRVHGLDLGASDYLVKPFYMEELLARVRALLRQAPTVESSVLTAGDITLDLAQHTVRRGDAQVELAAREFALLSYMMRNKNKVLSREMIEDHIWNFDYEGGTNLVDVYISLLRKKLGDGPENRMIRTLRGSGYMLACKE